MASRILLIILSSTLEAFDEFDFEGDLLLKAVSFEVYNILTTIGVRVQINLTL